MTCCKIGLGIGVRLMLHNNVCAYGCMLLNLWLNVCFSYLFISIFWAASRIVTNAATCHAVISPARCRWWSICFWNDISCRFRQDFRRTSELWFAWIAMLSRCLLEVVLCFRLVAHNTFLFFPTIAGAFVGSIQCSEAEPLLLSPSHSLARKVARCCAVTKGPCCWYTSRLDRVFGVQGKQGPQQNLCNCRCWTFQSCPQRFPSWMFFGFGAAHRFGLAWSNNPMSRGPCSHNCGIRRQTWLPVKSALAQVHPSNTVLHFFCTSRPSTSTGAASWSRDLLASTHLTTLGRVLSSVVSPKIRLGWWGPRNCRCAFPARSSQTKPDRPQRSESLWLRSSISSNSPSLRYSGNSWQSPGLRYPVSWDSPSTRREMPLSATQDDQNLILIDRFVHMMCSHVWVAATVWSTHWTTQYTFLVHHVTWATVASVLPRESTILLSASLFAHAASFFLTVISLTPLFPWWHSLADGTLTNTSPFICCDWRWSRQSPIGATEQQLHHYVEISWALDGWCLLFEFLWLWTVFDFSLLGTHTCRTRTNDVTEKITHRCTPVWQMTFAF